MPKPRKAQISLEDTPYYHCMSRCVRRAFLCGKDPLSGRNYEHRRGWVEKRLLFLAKVFAIDICAYAVMSNHTHLVLHIDKSKAEEWSVDEVIARWHMVSKGTELSNAYLDADKKQTLTEAQVKSIGSLCEVWRRRLYDISWFMRFLNEPIARQANKEDNCTGRFWEGRFKSQALLDKAALIACMAYVDLNPIRAKISKTPEMSDYTSVKKRARSAMNHRQPHDLMPFIGSSSNEVRSGIPFHVLDYFKIIDMSGRAILSGTKERRSCQTSSILLKLGLSEENWLKITHHLEGHFCGAIGHELQLREYHKNIGQKRTTGLSSCRELLACV